MSVFQINEILARYGNLSVAGGEVEQVFIELLKEVYGIELERERVTYDRDSIHVDASPAIRARIMQIKPQIIDELEKRLGARRTEEIS